MIKREEAISGCWAKAADDEPLFVLRAQDMLAPYVVEVWAAEAARFGVGAEKVAAARRLAGMMRDWPGRKLPD